MTSFQLTSIALVPVVALLAIFVGLVFKGIDRKLAARMQARIGPPVIQPFRDVRKLLLKESIVPDTAIPWIFNLAPVVALAATLTILLYVPVGGFEPLLSGYGDLILVLYLLTIPSIALVVAGFSSGSPYAAVGAQREMVTMMSYEFPLATAIVAFAWRISYHIPEISAFSMGAISSIPVWGIVGPLGFVGFLLLLLVLLFIIPAELSKIPFDAAEAETEIAGGLLTEYSGRNLALFYLADGVKTIALTSVIVALFFPYGIAGVLKVSGEMAPAADALFFLVKIFLVMFFSVTFMRVAFARLKIDQIVYVYWFPLTIISFFGLFLIIIDAILGGLL